MAGSTKPFTIGWTEWVRLPDLGLPAIRAKIDTGARTSALHAFQIEPFGPASAPMVRFGIHPVPGRTDIAIYCSAPVVGQRDVTSSNGESETRYVIATRIAMGPREWQIEVTLANRETMAYRMLLGRQAIRGDIHVDPAAAYLQPKLSYRPYRQMPRHELVHRPLRIALLTHRPRSRSSKRLIATATARGHVVEPIDPARLSLVLDQDDPRLLAGTEPVGHYDAVIPRLRIEDGPFGAAVARQLEQMGAFAINPGDALDRLIHPFAACQRLAQLGVAQTVRTISGSASEATDRLRPKAELSFLIVAGNTVAAIEWRHGRVSDATLRPLIPERALAERAAASLDLGLAGVDVVGIGEGAAVSRVSGTPSLASFESATGVPAAERVIAEIEARVRSWQRTRPLVHPPGDGANGPSRVATRDPGRE